MVVIESGNGYRVTSWHNGLAYEIEQEASGKTVFLQGDEASDWRAEYDDLQTDAGLPNTRASRFTWRQLLDDMCGVYFH